MRRLSMKDLKLVVQGAAFLGSGGGGPIACGTGMVKRIAQLTKRKGIDLAALEDIGADDDVLVIADVGGGDVFVPNQDRGSWNAFQLMKKVTGRNFKFIVPVEIGPENSLSPAAVAARAGIPLVDADGAGRAVPVLEMTTYAALGPKRAPVSPAAICSVDGHGVVIYEQTPEGVEEVMRPVLGLKHFADSAGIGMWAMKGATLRACAVPGGISRALAVGKILARRGSARTKLKALARAIGKKPVPLFSGIMGASNEQLTAGFDFGTVTVHSVNPRGPSCVVTNQNENIAAWRSDRGAPLATAPDSLCWMADDGTPFSNAEAPKFKGKRVTLYGIPADKRLRVPYITKVCETLMASLGYPGGLVRVKG